MSGSIGSGSAAGGWRRGLALMRKDLLVEWRAREAITAMAVLALLVALLLGFALGAEAGRAPAVLWVALAMAAIVGVARPTQAEAEEQTLETLLLYPGSREHLYWGKWAALTVMLMLLLAFLLVVLGVLFNVDLWTRLPLLLAAGFLGIAGLSAVGTLFAALVLHLRGRELLMPLLLLPVALPVVLAGVRVTEGILRGSDAGLWAGVLAFFDLMVLLVAPLLYEVVMEEV